MTDLNDRDAPTNGVLDPPGDRAPDRPDDRSNRRDPMSPPEPRRITIQIDRKEYVVPPALLDGGTLTGAEIRRLADPDIGSDRDLFEIVPGGSDRKIDAGDAVEIRDGMRFFSAPATINPGSRAGHPEQGGDHVAG